MLLFCVGWIVRPRPRLWFTRSSVVTCGLVVSTGSLGLGSKTLWKNGFACLTYPVLQYLGVMTPVVAMGQAIDCGTQAVGAQLIATSKGTCSQLSDNTCLPKT